MCQFSAKGIDALVIEQSNCGVVNSLQKLALYSFIVMAAACAAECQTRKYQNHKKIDFSDFDHFGHGHIQLCNQTSPQQAQSALRALEFGESPPAIHCQAQLAECLVRIKIL